MKQLKIFDKSTRGCFLTITLATALYLTCKSLETNQFNFGEC